eukprot:g15364.t1
MLYYSKAFYRSHAACIFLQMSVVWLALNVFSFWQPASAEVFKGWVKPKSQFFFLGKFCFMNDPSGSAPAVGSVQVSLEASSPDAWLEEGSHLLLFDDEDSGWPALQRGMACQDAGQHVIAKHAIPKHGNWEFKTHVTEKIRPRFWWFVLSNCKAEALGGHVKFRLETKNVGADNILNTQFGVNQWGSVARATFSCVFFSCLLLLHVMGQLAAASAGPAEQTEQGEAAVLSASPAAAAPAHEEHASLLHESGADELDGGDKDEPGSEAQQGEPGAPAGSVLPRGVSSRVPSLLALQPRQIAGKVREALSLLLRPRRLCAFYSSLHPLVHLFTSSLTCQALACMSLLAHIMALACMSLLAHIMVFSAN